MKSAKILVIGGGIGGLTAAIALRRKGFDVEIIEKDPSWKVYGVGIIQQSNVVRAMDELGLLDHYLSAAFGFDFVEIYLPDGRRVARIPSPRLIEGRTRESRHLATRAAQSTRRPRDCQGCAGTTRGDRSCAGG